MRVPEDQALKLNDQVGLNPNMGPMKRLYDEGKVAIIQGVGYPNPNRSHFRSMDIWHTCEPDKQGTEGWLGRTIRDLDPDKENVLTGVNFGRGLPRALATPGVPVASVGNLETYGVLTGIDGEDQREEALDVFSRIYSPTIGRSAVVDYLSQTGMDALKGADILSGAPGVYSSTVEYGGDVVAQYMKNIAQVHLAGFGTRVLYTTAPYNSFDTHAGEMQAHAKLWGETSSAVADFYDDLKQNNAADESGAAGIHRVRAAGPRQRLRHRPRFERRGLCGRRKRSRADCTGSTRLWLLTSFWRGDLHFNNDFRSIYSTLLENWMGLDAQPIVNGTFEKFDFV